MNLSDLAAKGARPLGVLLGYSLTGDDGWDARFLAGLGRGARRFGMPLLGGDTVAMPAGAPRALGLTAIGRADRDRAVARGRQPGDALWVTGTIGDAGAGLRDRPRRGRRARSPARALPPPAARGSKRAQRWPRSSAR